jgi:hypothetical protein
MDALKLRANGSFTEALDPKRYVADLKTPTSSLPPPTPQIARSGQLPLRRSTAADLLDR